MSGSISRGVAPGTNQERSMVEIERLRGARSREWACAPRLAPSFAPRDFAPRACPPRVCATRAFAALLGALLCAGADAQPPANPAAATVAGFTYVKSLGGIDEYQLDSNGLTVLLVPRPLRAGGDVPGDLPRRLAQRGDGHDRARRTFSST